MPTVQLSDRTLLRIEGPDAEHFLQNILTTDLDALGTGEAKPGALLSPQGKILFDFLIARDGDNAFLLDCRRELADDFLRRLMLYRLRAKADISKQDQLLVHAFWDIDSGGSQNDSSSGSLRYRDTRFPASLGVTRLYGDGVATDADQDAWSRLKIQHGVAESGSDYEAGDAFPHDVLLDQSDGVGFRKGCYVGQEVVSRMQHRGTARRRVMIVTSEQDLPRGTSEVRANEKTIGALGSANGADGLAIMRIDKVRDAIDGGHAITIGGVPVTLSIPSWARYTLPQTDAGADDA
ncbi:folate-binding protein [Mesorhizobium sp. CAU 1741]|uniref:CAF17-like 4Fe-4S cluster assembly/insertion protein YgfZ n=1 Tax=Mesorhizobium sp. CAU 1741 TaxID=3140366 RepID=UPI00325A5E17